MTLYAIEDGPSLFHHGMAEWDDLAKVNARDEAEVLKRYGLK